MSSATQRWSMVPDRSDAAPARRWLLDRNRAARAALVVVLLLVYGYVVQGEYRTVGEVAVLFVVGTPSAYVGFTVVEYAIRSFDA
jgi:hypothetical protein